MRDLALVRFTQHRLGLSNPHSVSLGDLKNCSILNRPPSLPPLALRLHRIEQLAAATPTRFALGQSCLKGPDKLF
jgi:hypothetical protein